MANDKFFRVKNGIEAPSGSAASPSITIAGDLDTGMFSGGADSISLTTGGVERLNIDSSGDFDFKGGTLSNTNLSGGTTFDLGSAASPSITFTGDLNTGIYSPLADQLGISTNGTLRLSVTTTSINSTLPIDLGSNKITSLAEPTISTHSDTKNYVDSVSGGTPTFADGSAAAPSITFTSDTNTGIYRSAADQIAFTAGGVKKAHFGAGGLVISDGDIQNVFGTAADPSYTFDNDTDTGIYRSAADVMSFSAGGVENFRTDTSGVRIINGVLRNPSGTPASPSYTFSGDTDTGIYRVTTDHLGISVGGTLVTSHTSSGLTIQSGFFRSTDGSAASPSITFTSDGDTGIYRNAADELGFSAGGSQIVLISSTGINMSGIISASTGSAAAPAFTFNADNTTGLYMPAVGNIDLSADGVSRFRVDTSGARVLSGNLRNLDGSASAPSYTFGLDTNCGMFRPTTDTLAFSTGGAERVRIANTGNMGIGITPNAVVVLDIKEPSASADAILGLAANSGNRVQLVAYNQANSSRASFGIKTVGAGGTFEALHIDENQNVGIGTSIPSNKLTVSTSDVNGGITVNGANSPAITLNDTTDSGYASIGTANTGRLILSADADGSSTGTLEFRTGGVERARIDTAGNVGIGTTTPNADSKLTVTGGGIRVEAGAPRLRLFDTVATNDPYGEISSNEDGSIFISADPSVQGNSSSLIVFNTDAAERMRIDSAGNVGIGTTTPGTKLQINGADQEDLLLLNGGTSYVGIRGNNSSGIRIRGGGSSEGGAIELAGGSRASDPGIIKFSTNPVFGTSIERMRIDGDGDILLPISNQQLYWTGGNGIINSNSSVYINIDSNNNQTGEQFLVSKDRTGTTGGTDLFGISEGGNMEVFTSGAQMTWSGGDGYINTTDSFRINIDSNNNQTDQSFSVAHNNTSTASTELFKVNESGLVEILVGDLDMNGNNINNVTLSGLFADGSASAPSIAFTSDTDTGIFRVGSNHVGISGDLTVEDAGPVLNIKDNNTVSSGTLFGAIRWKDSADTTVAEIGYNSTINTEFVIRSLVSGSNIEVNADENFNAFSDNGYISLNSEDSMYFNIDSNNDSSGTEFKWGHNNTLISSTALMRLDNNGTLQLSTYGAGTLSTDGSGNISASDARIKTILNQEVIGRDTVMALTPRWWDYNGVLGYEPGDPQLGFVAQEVAEVNELFAPGSNEVPVEEKRRNYHDRAILASLVKHNQELEQDKEDLQSKVSELEGTLSEVLQRLNALENK